MEENSSNIDLEYKRYLQIIRPYLSQLVDEQVIKLCNAWIQRLSNCTDKEKPIRNKYIFVLCYQLAKGILDDPFLKLPPTFELPRISEIAKSASSSSSYVAESEDDDNNTQLLYKNTRNTKSESEYQTKAGSVDNTDSEIFTSQRFSLDEKSSKTTKLQAIHCYPCPQMMSACAAELCSDLYKQSQDQDQYEYRANNLVLRLREIKKQNLLLHNELMALKQESKGKTSCESLIKVHIATSACLESESYEALESIRNKLQAAEEDRSNLMQTINSLQEQLDNMHEIKNREIEEMEARHKIEKSKIKASLRDENNIIYEKKLEELKVFYEGLLKNIKDGSVTEMNNLTKSHNEVLLNKDKIIQEKDKIIREKENEIIEKIKALESKTACELEKKNTIIQSKESEIITLKKKLEEEQNNFHSILHKLLDKPVEDPIAENVKSRSQELEKRLIKLEKSKSKCIKSYEAKISSLQREKHLAECSLQLQLMRQRAQVVNEIADENDAELHTALEKLEAKYKDIIANVQSTAIERRLQDEITINSIVKAACVCSVRNEVNHSQFPGKPDTAPHNRAVNHSCDSEFTGHQARKLVGIQIIKSTTQQAKCRCEW
ncbi:hypothetical protein O0L34_g9792 [Tuta absoluta]|nr:hypothetical protein O0L34_g9792 [Tuta absoluta]